MINDQTPLYMKGQCLPFINGVWIWADFLIIQMVSTNKASVSHIVFLNQYLKFVKWMIGICQNEHKNGERCSDESESNLIGVPKVSVNSPHKWVVSSNEFGEYILWIVILSRTHVLGRDMRIL
jgi:hypothetical protein